MTPARRRQLLQQMASQNTASGVAMIRRQAEAEEAAGNPPAAPFPEPARELEPEPAPSPAPAESLPAVPFIAPKKRRRRRKKSAADAPRKPGRPALGEAGPAARVSVSLAPETMAAVRLAARRRKVKLGTVLRELAEAWAAQTSRP